MLRHTLLCLSAALATASAQRSDTTRVRADNPPTWGASVQLVKEVSIGKIDGPPEYAFGSVDFVASLPDGRFFVYDGKDTVVRRYDAAGKYLGRMGRGGAGPGEFRWPQGMVTVGDSLLVLWDPRNARLTHFSATGELRRSFQVALGTSSFGSDVFHAGPNGVVGILTSDRTPMSGGTRKQVWVRIGLDGRVVDTIPAVGDSSVTPGFVLLTSDGARYNFNERIINKPLPTGGSITARSTSYRFAMTAPNGHVTLVDRAWTPLPLRGEERTEWLAQAASFKNAPQPSGSTPRPPAPDYRIPEVKPAIRDIFGDAFGRVWVDLYGPAEKRTLPPPTSTRPRVTWRERSMFDVFDANARYLGRIVLPPKSQIVSVQRDRIWLLVQGPDDEDVIEVYRIRPERP